MQREKRERKEKKVIHRVSPALAIAVLAPIVIVQRENEKSEMRNGKYEVSNFVALVRNHLSQLRARERASVTSRCAHRAEGTRERV